METPVDISKLPKWAQSHIKSISRERDVAVRALHEWSDSQTESPVSIMEMECIGGKRGPTHFTRFVQTRQITINWHGVELTIHLREEGSMNENCIQLKWGDAERGMSHVAMVPTSFQSVELISKKNLRRP